jgi:protein-tyrosine phosphatase
MAEYILKDMLKKNNIDNVEVYSKATCYDEDGNDLYYLAKEKLNEKNIPFTKRESHRLEKEDYDKYDLIIGMDDSNIKNIIRIVGEDTDNKVYKLNHFNGDETDIKDPWYTRDFDTAYDEIFKGVSNLLEFIKKNQK